MEQGYIQQLEKLAELKQKGILSDAEFNLKKEELLKPTETTSILTSKAINEVNPEGTYWLPIPSLVLGIICALALFDESEWDSDTTTGLLLFAIIGLVLGILGVSKQTKGRGMSIAGIVLSSLGLLAWLGMQSN